MTPNRRKFNIFNHADDSLIAVVMATSFRQATQEAACYMVESGRDREYDYAGYYIEYGDLTK